MANYYCTVTAADSIVCRLVKALELIALFDPGRDTAQDGAGAGRLIEAEHECGLSVQYDRAAGTIYVYGEDNARTDEIPDEILRKLGEIIAEAGLPYLGFGYSCTCDRCRPGSHSGGEFRVTSKGQMIEPDLVYTEPAA